jgi:hypothetical protein
MIFENLISKISYKIFFPSFEGVCDHYLYQKSDGSLKCGFPIDHGLILAEAASQCAQNNAIIPELPSPNDQQILNIIRVRTLNAM